MDLYTDHVQIMLHFALPTVRPPTSHPLGFRAGHLRARENAVGADYERLDRIWTVPNNNNFASLACVHALGCRRGCNQRAQRASPRAARLTVTPRGVNSGLHTSFSLSESSDPFLSLSTKIRRIPRSFDPSPCISVHQSALQLVTAPPKIYWAPPHA